MSNKERTGFLQSLTTLIAILVAVVAVGIDRNYYRNSIAQTQANFERNYRRDSIIQATNFSLTQMQIGLLQRQVYSDSVSLQKQLEIARIDLSVQLQSQNNLLRIHKEKFRRVLNEISLTTPNQGYVEYMKWSNHDFHSFLRNVYKYLEQEEANSYILSRDSISMVWNEMMRRIERSSQQYADTAGVMFLGEPTKSISQQWADQRYRDGAFVSDRLLAMQLLLRNMEVPEILYGFRQPYE